MALLSAKLFLQHSGLCPQATSLHHGATSSDFTLVLRMEGTFMTMIVFMGVSTLSLTMEH